MMRSLLHILSYPFSVLFYILFGLLLLVFDLVQRICLTLFGYKLHKTSVDLFNGCILLCLHLVGTTFSFKIKEMPAHKVPVIIVSNHQSMWDIPPIIWFLRKLHPKFISKIELGKRIPSISYNLKYGGSVLIDRKNPVQATAEIAKIGRYISEYNRSVVIFPEGTRSRTGEPKKFHRKGLLTLFKNAPDAVVLPISINNSWKLQRYGMFPIPMFVRLKFQTHSLITVSDHDPHKLIDLLQKQISEGVY